MVSERLIRGPRRDDTPIAVTRVRRQRLTSDTGIATDGGEQRARVPGRTRDPNGDQVTDRQQQRETWIDQQIREAQERGEFDGLSGAGEPIADLDRPHDALWWVRKKLKEENFSYLPPTLQLRRDVEVAEAAIERARSEHEVRALITAVNARIRHVNRTDVIGPPSTVMMLDEDEIIRAWRQRRVDDAGAPRDQG